MLEDGRTETPIEPGLLMVEERSDDYYVGLYSGLSADGDSGGYGMQEL